MTTDIMYHDVNEELDSIANLHPLTPGLRREFMKLVVGLVEYYDQALAESEKDRLRLQTELDHAKRAADADRAAELVGETPAPADGSGVDGVGATDE